ncbi:MAG: NAD(P)H-dependent flavin oxidoreductase [Dehalococcoidia bacterium]|nr:Nitronate monooxygenase [Chloroflexota bacterium]MBT9160604.1 Nitronate monooxygenase [Chloroflexota bacterium]MBT9162377.1 Nitronate monooxygenase [Chloroflexota bacterium]
MFQTRLTQLLGIEYPIIQGGMQWISRSELVGAVSNAGGLGILSALTFASPADLAAEIRKTRGITDKPFGVNLTMLPTLHPVDIDSYIDVIVNEGVQIVETAGRNPEQYMGRLKAGGIKVIHKCVAVRFARTAERIGCDVVSIDGYECAGHPGEEDVTSLILIPMAADAVKIPVVASGGFGDARGLVAALALGADGINMGTRFMATQEAPIHPRVKEWLIQATERDTMIILRSLRNSVRVLRNPVAEKVAEMEKRGAALEELVPLISGQGGKELLETGELDRGLQACGQVVGLIHDMPSVKEVIDRIVDEARDIVERFYAPVTVHKGRIP